MQQRSVLGVYNPVNFDTKRNIVDYSLKYKEAMSSPVNRVQLIGYLGNDPEVRKVEGKVLVRFPLATNETYYTRDKIHQATMWHACAAWGKTGEQAKGLKKGQGILLEGSIRYYTYNKNNIPIKGTEIKVDKFYSLKK